ncbi:MAG: GNAT family N-acetyltransferase [Oscillospiraceae bacterium]
MDANLCFEPLGPAHLDACAAIARQAPDVWGRADLEKAEDGGTHRAVVALQGGSVVGFACFLVVDTSADLQMVVIDVARRRQHLAETLLRHALGHLRTAGVQRVLLEVRTSNSGAVALYEKLGFKTLAVRQGMYHTPPENGLLMATKLTDEGDRAT